MADLDLATDIEIIRETVAEWSVSSGSKQSGYGPRALIVMAVYEIELQEYEDGLYYWHYDSFYAEMLATDAAGHWDVHRLYRDVIASKLEADIPLFRLERLFLVGTLKGTWKAPPIPKANKLEDHFTRNLLILSCMNTLVQDHSLKPSVSTSMQPKNSDAPTIVSQAFCDAGHHEVTPEAIKGVLQNKKLSPWVEKLEGARTRQTSLKRKLMFQSLRKAEKQIVDFYAELGGLSQQ